MDVDPNSIFVVVLVWYFVIAAVIQIGLLAWMAWGCGDADEVFPLLLTVPIAGVFLPVVLVAMIWDDIKRRRRG